MTTPHTPPTQAELDALKALEAKITQGDWYAVGGWTVLSTLNSGDMICNISRREEHKENTEFIAIARNELPRLITEVERLRVAPITFCFCPRCGVQMNPKHDTSEVDPIARLTKEVEELRKDKETSDLLIKGLEGNLAACEQENERLRGLINPFDVSTAMQKPIRASADERLVADEPVKNDAGSMCGLCDGFHEHEHPTLKCTFCGRSGLAENMVGHECAAMQQKGEE